LAEALHDLVGDEERPFVVFDCGALPGSLVESELFGHEAGAFTGATHRHLGALERANGGTLFLDEVGELSAELQVKLLRAVESGEFRRVGSERMLRSSARIVAATNRNLDQLIRQGQFRSDLYYRLAVVRIRVPALRERSEDIPLLIEHFLALAGASESRLREVPGLVHLLQSYRWPGNVRELRNVVERLDVLPLPDALPTPFRPAEGEKTLADFRGAREWAIDQFERAYVEDLLRRTRGNVTRAAELAQVTRRYVTALMTKHGIERGRFVDG
jgi:DNA-binding NtrC family response regulator